VTRARAVLAGQAHGPLIIGLLITPILLMRHLPLLGYRYMRHRMWGVLIRGLLLTMPRILDQQTVRMTALVLQRDRVLPKHLVVATSRHTRQPTPNGWGRVAILAP